MGSLVNSMGKVSQPTQSCGLCCLLLVIKPSERDYFLVDFDLGSPLARRLRPRHSTIAGCPPCDWCLVMPILGVCHDSEIDTPVIECVPIDVIPIPRIAVTETQQNTVQPERVTSPIQPLGACRIRKSPGDVKIPAPLGNEMLIIRVDSSIGSDASVSTIQSDHDAFSVIAGERYGWRRQELACSRAVLPSKKARRNTGHRSAAHHAGFFYPSGANLFVPARAIRRLRWPVTNVRASTRAIASGACSMRLNLKRLSAMRAKDINTASARRAWPMIGVRTPFRAETRGASAVRLNLKRSGTARANQINALILTGHQAYSWCQTPGCCER